MTDDRRSRISPAPWSPTSSVASFSFAVSGLSSGAMSAALRAISTTGQKVMPSPYGRQRPRSTRAPPPTSPRNASTRCVLPTPASPSSVMTRQPPRPTVSRRPFRSSASSGSRPTSTAWAVSSGATVRRVADVDQAVGRDPLGLALELERLDRLDLDLPADEAVGDLADQHLVRRRGLLEARRDVHGVARREALLRVLVGVRDHLAGVDADPLGDLDAVQLEQVLVQAIQGAWSCRGPRARRAGRRPRGLAAGRTRP